jgi:hypothetical protein
MLGGLLSIYDDSGCYDWSMDATLGDLLERRLGPGRCLGAGPRGPLPTADLAPRVGVGGGVSREVLTASDRRLGIWWRRGDVGEVLSAASPSTRKKAHWRRSRSPSNGERFEAVLASPGARPTARRDRPVCPHPRVRSQQHASGRSRSVFAGRQPATRCFT